MKNKLRVALCLTIGAPITAHAGGAPIIAWFVILPLLMWLLVSFWKWGALIMLTLGFLLIGAHGMINSKGVFEFITFALMAGVGGFLSYGALKEVFKRDQ